MRFDRAVVVALLLGMPSSCSRSSAPTQPGVGHWTLFARPPGMQGAGEVVAWSGQELLVWGGAGSCAIPGDAGVGCNDGARFDPTSARWTAMTTTGAPQRRTHSAGAWAGDALVVWSGECDAKTLCTDGASYQPATDSWIPLPTSNAPAPRRDAMAVSADGVVFFWGGQDEAGTKLSTGARFDVASSTWTAMSDASAPSARTFAAVAWTGSELLVWGGEGQAPDLPDLASGSAYDPKTDTWRPLSAANAPSPRRGASGSWTGKEFFVWGGVAGSGFPADGAAYDPSTDSWRRVSSDGAPAGGGHAVVWSGAMVIVWGGAEAGGGLYDPMRDAWRPMSTDGAPIVSGFGAWTGTTMIVYQGFLGDGSPGQGGIYAPPS